MQYASYSVIELIDSQAVLDMQGVFSVNSALSRKYTSEYRVISQYQGVI